MALTAAETRATLEQALADGAITQAVYDTEIAKLDIAEGTGIPGYTPPVVINEQKKGTTTTIAKPKDTISFNFKDHTGTLNTKPFTRPSTGKTKTASFIKGGTPEQKKALARRIANMTLTGKSTADAAKIKTARLWFTGQVKGASKGKKAPVVKGSVKWKLQHPNKKVVPVPGAPVPSPIVKGRGGAASGTSKTAKPVVTPGQTPGIPEPTAVIVATESATKLLTGTQPVAGAERGRTRSRQGSKTKASPRYGGALGRNPYSVTPERQAAVITKKKDRFRGRKARASKLSDATLYTEHAPGSWEASQDAEKKDLAVKKAARLAKEKAGSRPRGQKLGPPLFPGSNEGLKSSLNSVVDFLTTGIPQGPAKVRKPTSDVAAAAAKARATSEATGYGYVAPKPKAKPQTRKGGSSSLKGKRSKGPGGGR